MSVLLPEPDTPVMHTKTPRGILISMSLRLFCRAPIIWIELPFVFRLVCGKGIFFLPDRYCPVRDFLEREIFCTVPSAIM